MTEGKKLKVLLVNDFLYAGGAETVFRDTADILSDECDVTLFFASEHYATASSPVSYIFSRHYRRQFLARLREYQPDIVHLHGYYHLLSPAVLSAIREYKTDRNVRCVYTAHDSHLLCPNSVSLRYNRWTSQPKVIEGLPGMLQILFYRWDHRSVLHSLMKKMQWLYAYRFRRLYRVFDQIVSPSTRIAGLLAQRYPFISTGVLRNPVQGVEKLRNLQPRSISSSPLRLVFAGRLSQEKNILAFLKLFLQLGSQGVVLDIIGDGPEEPAIHELLSERDTRHQVNLLGRLTHPELMEKLPQYHALVLCSLNETAPLSIVEAALSGIRVLTLPRFGMKEMGDICGGTVYFEMNPQSLQQSLTDLSAAAQQSLPVVRNIEDIIDTFSRTSYKMQLLQYYRTSNNQGF